MLAQVLKEASEFLQKNSGTLTHNDPNYEAKLLTSHCLGLSFSALIINESMQVEQAAIDKLWAQLKQRALGEPIAYIIGTQPFWTLELEVSKATLIPRSDTETLVETALNLDLPRDAKVHDLATGTGAIAIALASERKSWQVSGSDYKAEIVALAARNAKLNQVDVEFVKSDWFAQIGSRKFHLITANPPYVEPDSEYLTQGDLRFEPLSALVADDSGFADIALIIQTSREFLMPSGVVMIEHGLSQGQATRECFTKYGFVNIQTVSDLNGLERITHAVFDTP